MNKVTVSLSNSRLAGLIAKIDSREARIGIVGMGYVGLPLALLFSSQRFRVTGFDIVQSKVDTLNAGKSYILSILPSEIQEAQKAGFSATADYSQAAQMDAVIICVPTPLNEHHEPDLSFVTGTVKSHRSLAARGPAHCAGKHHLSRHHRGDCRPPAGSRQPRRPESLALARRARPACRLFARARGPRQHGRGAPRHPQGRRRLRPGGHPTRLGNVRRHLPPRGDRQQPLHGRDDQAAGKHLPLRQHRAGQRTQAALHEDGHRHPRGDRRGQNQALRLPGLLSRPRPGRPLHSHRSLLSLLEGPAVRLPHPLHRAGRRN